MSEITNNDIDKMAFVAAVSDACKETDKGYTFLCSICGGLAKAIKNSYNGHCAGAWPSCGTRMIE